MIPREFYIMIRDIVKSEPFLRMKHLRHHLRCSVYDHSVKVAYLCYLHHKRRKTAIPLKELVRGALLHDFYLYDRKKCRTHAKGHLSRHAHIALRNARTHYPNLTPTEVDMIEHHMFPLSPIPPRTRAGWLVCFYDKVAAISDLLGKNKWKRRRRASAKTKK